MVGVKTVPPNIEKPFMHRLSVVFIFFRIFRICYGSYKIMLMMGAFWTQDSVSQTIHCVACQIWLTSEGIEQNPIPPNNFPDTVLLISCGWHLRSVCHYRTHFVEVYFSCAWAPNFFAIILDYWMSLFLHFGKPSLVCVKIILLNPKLKGWKNKNDKQKNTSKGMFGNTILAVKSSFNS